MLTSISPPEVFGIDGIGHHWNPTPIFIHGIDALHSVAVKKSGSSQWCKRYSSSPSVCRSRTRRGFNE
jgi:hypothetical protein